MLPQQLQSDLARLLFTSLFSPQSHGSDIIPSFTTTALQPIPILVGRVYYLPITKLAPTCTCPVDSHTIGLLSMGSSPLRELLPLSYLYLTYSLSASVAYKLKLKPACSAPLV